MAWNCLKGTVISLAQNELHHVRNRRYVQHSSSGHCGAPSLQKIKCSYFLLFLEANT